MRNVSSSLDRLIGESAAMQKVRDDIRNFASSPMPTLITGESGTGKEVAARAIAELSGLRQPVTVNCAAIQESLIESELFGHCKGAFTGALSDRAGLVAAADGGILYLDELGELTRPAQAKLLRVLEDGDYRPVGDDRSRRASFRLIAATNEDIEEAVTAGRFRRDLLYRIDGLRIVLPALRERPEDIPPIARHLLRRLNAKYPGLPTDLSPGAVRVLCDFEWPGNVRQLLNVLEVAGVTSRRNAAVDADVLRDVLHRNRPAGSNRRVASIRHVRTLAEAVDEATAAAVQDALAEARGNRAETARLLGVSEASLYRLLAKLRKAPAEASSSPA